MHPYEDCLQQRDSWLDEDALDTLQWNALAGKYVVAARVASQSRLAQRTSENLALKVSIE